MFETTVDLQKVSCIWRAIIFLINWSHNPLKSVTYHFLKERNCALPVEENFTTFPSHMQMLHWFDVKLLSPINLTLSMGGITFWINVQLFQLSLRCTALWMALSPWQKMLWINECPFHTSSFPSAFKMHIAAYIKKKNFHLDKNPSNSQKERENTDKNSLYVIGSKLKVLFFLFSSFLHHGVIYCHTRFLFTNLTFIF